MSEFRNYTVIQTREVTVTANDPLEAAEIGNAAFNGNIHNGDLADGHVVKPVRVRSIEASEDY